MKNIVATINHSKYKDVLLNNKYLRHSMYRFQKKNHKIGTYGINKISFSCVDDEIHIRKMDTRKIIIRKMDISPNTQPNAVDETTNSHVNTDNKETKLLIIASIETLKRQNKKCGKDVVLALVKDSYLASPLLTPKIIHK